MNKPLGNEIYFSVESGSLGLFQCQYKNRSSSGSQNPLPLVSPSSDREGFFGSETSLPFGEVTVIRGQ